MATLRVSSKVNFDCAFEMGIKKKPMKIKSSFLFIFITFFSSNQAYKTGNTINVNTVAETKPPTTTVAKGR